MAFSSSNHAIDCVIRAWPPEGLARASPSGSEGISGPGGKLEENLAVAGFWRTPAAKCLLVKIGQILHCDPATTDFMPEMLAVGIDGLLTGLDPVASDRLRLVRKGISPTGRAPDIDVELFALAVNNWHKAKIEGAQQRAGHNFVLMNQELIDAVSTELGGAPRTCSFWRIWASSQDESLTVDEQMFEAFEEYLAEEWPVSVVELTVTNLRRACQDLGLLGVQS